LPRLNIRSGENTHCAGGLGSGPNSSFWFFTATGSRLWRYHEGYGSGNRARRTSSTEDIAEPLYEASVVAVVDWQDMDAFLSLSTQVFQQLMALLAVVKEFHHLFERNCDE